MSTNITDVVTAGALVRRHVRTELDLLRMRWTEHKGWTSSDFVITGTLDQWDVLLGWIATVEREAS